MLWFWNLFSSKISKLFYECVRDPCYFSDAMLFHFVYAIWSFKVRSRDWLHSRLCKSLWSVCRCEWNRQTQWSSWAQPKLDFICCSFTNVLQKTNKQKKRLKILKLCMCVTDNTGWQTNRKANDSKSDWPFPKIQGLRHRHLGEDIDCCCCCPRHRTKLPLLMQQGF
jgi:hypothetical protein